MSNIVKLVNLVNPMTNLIFGETIWQGKVDDNGRVVIPAPAREKLGITKGGDVTIILIDNKVEIICGRLKIGGHENVGEMEEGR